MLALCPRAPLYLLQPLTELLASLALVPPSILPSPQATIPTGYSLGEEGQMDLTVDHLALTQCLTFAFSHTNQADSASENPSAFLADPELREIEKEAKNYCCLTQVRSHHGLISPKRLAR